MRSVTPVLVALTTTLVLQHGKASTDTANLFGTISSENEMPSEETMPSYVKDCGGGWFSKTSGGLVDSAAICAEFGYNTIDKYGGNSGQECKHATDRNGNCQWKPGTKQCGQTVSWHCDRAAAARTRTGGGGGIHNTVTFSPSRTAGGCSYQGQHAFKWSSVGKKTFEDCVIEASKRGAMLTPGQYSMTTGWYGHRNGNRAMTGYWNSYRTHEVNSKGVDCVLGYAKGRQFTTSSAPLTNARFYGGLEWAYEDYGPKYFDECIQLAGKAGASIITPYTLGMTTNKEYFVHSVHMCCTYTWISANGHNRGYSSSGSGSRSPRKNCMVGYVDCIGTCATTTTTTTAPCGPESIGGKGEDYRGCQTQTRSGKTCQLWSSQAPHKHNNTPGADTGVSLNYCRNPTPDTKKTIWCYTVDPKTKWEYCNPMATTTIVTTTTTTTPLPPAAWTLGAEGEDCNTACGWDNCYQTEWWPASDEVFRKRVLETMHHEDCSSIEAGHWPVNPSQYPDYGNMCFWSAGRFSCGASHLGVRRFCPCKTAPGTTTAEPTTTTEVTTEAPTTTAEMQPKTGDATTTPPAPPGGDAPPPEGDKPKAQRRRRRTGISKKGPGRRRRRKGAQLLEREG